MSREQVAQGHDDDESSELSTALRMRRQQQELVVAVYNRKTGALFSSSAQVDPIF